MSFSKDMDFLAAVKTNNLTLAIKLLKENSDLKLKDQNISILYIALSNSYKDYSQILEFIEAFISHPRFDDYSINRSFIISKSVRFGDQFMVDLASMKLNNLDFLNYEALNIMDFDNIINNKCYQFLEIIIDKEQFDAEALYSCMLDFELLSNIRFLTIALKSPSFLKVFLRETGYNAKIEDIISSHYKDLKNSINISSESSTVKDYKALLKFKKYSTAIREEELCKYDFRDLL